MTSNSVSIARNVVSLTRVKSWVKNLFVFLPLLFTGSFLNLELTLIAGLTFLLFSLCASAVYVINDILDLERDRLHPKKKFRALPSGRLTTGQAWYIEGALILGVLWVASYLDPLVSGIAIAYFFMNLTYSTVLKHEVLVDVFVIALGFVLRVIAGAFAIGQSFPYWVIFTTFFICLFLALGKRRHELLFTDGEGGGNHRPVLDKYSEKLLDYLIVVTATITLVSYSMLIVEQNLLILSCPFVIYGMFRYMHIVYVHDCGGDPFQVVAGDRVLLANISAWMLVVTSTFVFAI